MSDLLNDRLHAMFSEGTQQDFDGPSDQGDGATQDPIEEKREEAITKVAEDTKLARPPAVDPKIEAAIRENERLKAELARLAPAPKTLSPEDEADLKAYRDLKARKDYDPVGVAEHFGYKPDTYAAKLAEMGAMTPERREIMELKAQLAETKEWRGNLEQNFQKQDLQGREARAFAEIQEVAKAGGEKYDLISRSSDGIARTMQLIKAHYAETSRQGIPEVLDIGTALAQVEAELLDKTLAPFYDSPKVRARISGKSGTASKGRSAPESSSARTSSAELSDDEGYKRAAEMLFSSFRRG